MLFEHGSGSHNSQHNGQILVMDQGQRIAS
jgi:hypothetical protein